MAFSIFLKSRYRSSFVFALLFLFLGCSSPESDIRSTGQYRFTEEFVVTADLSDDGTKSVIVTDFPHISVWDNHSHALIARWNVDLLGVIPLFVSISYDNRQLLVAGETQVVLLDIERNAEVGRWPIASLVDDKKVTSAGYFMRGQLFALGLNDGSVIVADINDGVFKKAYLHESNVTHLVVDEFGQYLYTAAHDGAVNKVSLADLEVVQTRQFEHRLSSLNLDNDSGRLFISDTLDEQVVVDSQSLETVGTLDYFERWRWFREALFVENSRFLITASSKTGMSLWNIETGEQVGFWDAKVYSFASHVSKMTINKDNQLVTLTNDAVVEFWDYAAALR